MVMVELINSPNGVIRYGFLFPFYSPGGYGGFEEQVTLVVDPALAGQRDHQMHKQ